MAIQIGSWLAEGQLAKGMGWAVWAASCILWILFAVTCHRLVLLELREADVAVVPGWGLRESLFLVWLVVSGAIILAVVLGALTIVGNTIGLISHDLLEAITNPIAKVVGTYLFARMALVLPATAIGVRSTLLKSWRQTRGNGWRMVVIVGVLPWAFDYAVSLVFGDDPGVARALFVSALGTVVLAIEISLLSLAYRELSAESAGQR